MEFGFRSSRRINGSVGAECFFGSLVWFFSGFLFANTIDGKGLLCTCVDERANFQIPIPSTLLDKMIALDETLKGKDGYWPLKCLSKGNWEKYSITGNPNDVDSFFIFASGKVEEHVLMQYNDVFYFFDHEGDPYVSNYQFISWSDEVSQFNLSRKTLFLTRRFFRNSENSSPDEVMQCEALESVKHIERAKAQYKMKFEKLYDEKKRINGNQL